MAQQEFNESERRIMDGTAWAEFCDALKSAGDVILDEHSPADPFERAEGFRYLSRLTRAALETFIEDADPRAPVFLRTCNETIKMGADNPDNYYQNAAVSGKYEYRITGTRGTVHYLGFGTQEGNYGATGSLDPSGYLDDSQLELDEDGSFEIHLSVQRKPGNWLPMTEKTRTLVVRQTFLDRDSERRAQLKIERVDGPHEPRYLTARIMDRGLFGSGQFVRGCAQMFARWTQGFRQHLNELPAFDPSVAQSAGGVPHIAYYHGYWELAPDEALVIDVTPPDCDYWNFQLNNHWMESLDYRYFDVVVNKHTARLGADGSLRIVVAHQDPGLDNWMNTAGHARGTMCLRWVRAQEHPTPATRVVKLAALKGTRRG